jgi:hypothetical protein
MTGRSYARIATSIVCAALTGCGTPAAPDGRVAIGSWGGVSIRLDVTAAGATVEYDCAHGTIDQPLVVDRDGRFSATGTHVREHGGPIRLDDPPDRHPARYAGQVSGTSMRLSVTLLDTSQVIGTFDAVFGANARVLKCL